MLIWGGVPLIPDPLSPQVIREWLESRPPSSTPLPPSRQGSAPTRSSVQHFHRPGKGPLAPQNGTPRAAPHSQGDLERLPDPISSHSQPHELPIP